MPNLRSAFLSSTAVHRSPLAVAIVALVHTCLAAVPVEASTRPKHALGHYATMQQPPAAKAAAPLAPSHGACMPVAGKLPMELALRHFVKAAVPFPRRFLIAAGTDSALSDTDMKALVAEFGPTYYYAGSEASKAKLRDKLTNLGPWPVMLIVKRSDKKVGTTAEIIRLGGHYVTGEFDGKSATTREYSLTCGVDGWILKEVKEEKGA
ncbi:MAG: hypothetical protein ABI120_24040 [Gemmatimonadaceae bacterium]